MIAGVGTAAIMTYRPDSVVEPQYTGLLAGAPSLVGDAESIVTKFESYRGQLAKLVNNVSQLYDTVSALPVYDADPTAIRVLHVSDIHLNLIAWNLIRSITAQFKIDVVVDTGDITDHGTGPEDNFVEEIGNLGVPYVFVRGNHDSKATQRAVARQKGAVVLDDSVKTVAGLRIYGLGDPRFTPTSPSPSTPIPTPSPPWGGRTPPASPRCSGRSTWWRCTTRRSAGPSPARSPWSSRDTPTPARPNCCRPAPASSSRAPPAAPACAPSNTTNPPP
nr:hypothetical protein GCM10020093_068110 [Planobispora longispora]